MRRLPLMAAVALFAGFMAYGCSESGGPGELTDVPTFTAQFNTTDGPFSVDLIADGGEMYGTEYGVKVGVVEIWNDFDNLYVRFRITDFNWCITETHLHIAEDVDGIPQTGTGNPKVGKFAFQHTGLPCVDHDTYFGIPLSDFGSFGDEIVIAAHAVVWDKTSETSITVVSSTETDVIEVNGASAEQKAVLANEPGSYPSCNSYGPDLDNSVWDNAVGSIFSVDPVADWIWNTLNPEHPIEGDVVTFQTLFEVPGYATGGALHITADNGYRAMLNGVDVGSAQLGPGFPTTLMETLTYPNPQQGNWGVASQGWQSVESYALSGLMSGENTLTIIAANEYMWNQSGYQGPDYYYSNWDPSGGSVTPDPFPGTGIEGDNVCRNPAGLIYKATIDYYERDETAWGKGVDFPGRNWATYFTYTIQCPPAGLVNGGFEAPEVATSQGWNIYDSGTMGLGWVVEWVDGSGGTYDPAHLELHRGVNNWNPKEGVQHAELDTDWDGPGGGINNEPASVRIYQDLQTCPGVQYKVEFAWSPRPNHADNKLTAFWDDTQLGTEYSASGGSNTYWTLVITGPTATGTTTRLSFTETGTANSLGMFLDAVSVEPIQ